jgi:hypothetical protein
MAIRPIVSQRKKPHFVGDVGVALDMLSKHTKENPMRVSQAMYDELIAFPKIAKLSHLLKIQPLRSKDL